MNGKMYKRTVRFDGSDVKISGEVALKTAGIVAEYNPFHEGHRYHIEETKRITGADYIVVAMSGDYVQRGEPAIIDKYARTRMALAGGADVVFELPCAYATYGAEHFAGAGTALLSGLGVCRWISFGCEWAEKEEMDIIADYLVREPAGFKEALREGIRRGLSYPAARAEAVISLLPPGRQERCRRLMKEPNHILALEYMKSVKKYDYKMEPVPVPRKGAGYHDEKLEGDYVSASAIRKAALRRASLNKKKGRPDPDREATAEDLRMQKALGPRYADFIRYIDNNEFVTWEDMMPLLRYNILYNKEMLHRFSGTDTELANRIAKLYEPEYTFEELVGKLHVKNMTDSALRRALLRILLCVSRQPWLEDGTELPIPYGRILGFRRSAAPLLKEIRKKAKPDIIQRPVLAKKLYTKYSREMSMFNCDINGAELYEQIAAGKCGRKSVREMVREQVIL